MKNEIMSFNATVREVSELVDLDDAALEGVIGGADASCGQLSSCPNLECIDKCGIKVIRAN